jgi:NAD-dependent SIR2 family protein deacetylase
VRFHENGPDIPDELLVARDEGNVLFFCGAGVSLAYAGLADFLKLAGSVIDDLGSLTGSQARRLHEAASMKLPSGKSYVPVDRMFSSLDLEFGPREVRDAVARALKPASVADLQAHRALIDLSRGSDGRPRLITTNFDRLFEACDPNLKSWEPSNLPTPERPAHFEGIIHIHVRVD